MCVIRNSVRFGCWRYFFNYLIIFKFKWLVGLFRMRKLGFLRISLVNVKCFFWLLDKVFIFWLKWVILNCVKIFLIFVLKFYVLRLFILFKVVCIVLLLFGFSMVFLYWMMVCIKGLLELKVVFRMVWLGKKLGVCFSELILILCLIWIL